MSRSRLVLIVLSAASVLWLGNMRGDDPPKVTKSGNSSQVPDRLLKAVSGKGAKGPAAPAAASKPAAEEPKAPEVKAAKPTPKQIAFVKSDLIPAYQSGEPVTILKLVSGQLSRWTDPQIAGINQLLAELHAPTLDKMITDARMNLVRAGMAEKGPEATSREAAIVLREIKRQIEEILAKAKSIELMKDPFPKPKNMMDFRDLLWAAHVQNNQLINADALASQGNLIAQSKVVAKAKNATAADKAIFATKFSEITDKIRVVHRELNERGVELRVERVKFANKVLEESKDIKERFLAAYAVGIDGELLILGFKEAAGSFVRPNLNSAGYAVGVTSEVECAARNWPATSSRRASFCLRACTGGGAAAMG